MAAEFFKNLRQKFNPSQIFEPIVPSPALLAACEMTKVILHSFVSRFVTADLY